MSAQTEQESIMAKYLVQALALEHVSADDIDPTASLFGSDAKSVGLDSIDALEIALMVQQKYGVELKSDDPETKSAFASLRSLTEHVLKRKQRD